MQPGEHLGLTGGGAPPGLPLLALLGLGLVCVLVLRRASAARTPKGCVSAPVVPGLPLIGSGLALGRGGARFLRACRQKVGATSSRLGASAGYEGVQMATPGLVITSWRKPSPHGQEPRRGGCLAAGWGRRCSPKAAKELGSPCMQYGDAFTLRLPGAEMTFLAAPPALFRYFSAPDDEITFAPAVEQFTSRVFGLPPAELLPRHLHLLASLRHALTPATLPGHAARLLDSLLLGLQSWPAAGQVRAFSGSGAEREGPAAAPPPAALALRRNEHCKPEQPMHSSDSQHLAAPSAAAAGGAVRGHQGPAL